MQQKKVNPQQFIADWENQKKNWTPPCNKKKSETSAIYCWLRKSKNKWIRILSILLLIPEFETPQFKLIRFLSELLLIAAKKGIATAQQLEYRYLVFVCVVWFRRKPLRWPLELVYGDWAKSVTFRRNTRPHITRQGVITFRLRESYEAELSKRLPRSD